ncbi:hypothetical protein ACKVMT_15175 [Halobacteriales archaeon Cl-PHB]
MTSLTDVYQGDVGSVAGRRRKLMGTALYLVGALAVVGAIPVATAGGVQSLLGLEVFQARELAGVLAGLGLPAVFVGIFAVLPAGSTTRAAAAIGASLAIFGVALFVHAYPYNWMADASGLAIATTVVYSLGLLTTFWCLFVAVATFKLRNDPGGSARMEVTEEGTLRVVQTERSSSLPLGGIGLFGNDPEGDVATQTNRNDGGAAEVSIQKDEGEILYQADDAATTESTTTAPSSSGSSTNDARAETSTGATDGSSQSRSRSSGAAGQSAGFSDPSPAGDGAGAVADPATAEDEVVEAVNTRGQPDKYCGNCEHFEYVRADGELASYCGFHDELMEDMEACDQWAAND